MFGDVAEDVARSMRWATFATAPCFASGSPFGGGAGLRDPPLEPYKPPAAAESTAPAMLRITRIHDGAYHAYSRCFSNLCTLSFVAT